METWKKIERLWKPFASTSASCHAAAACFHLISAFIPTTLVIIAVSIHFPAMIDQAQITIPILPEPVSDGLRSVMEYIGNGRTVTLLSASGLWALWSSSRTILVIRRGINAMEEQTVRTQYLHGRIRTLGSWLLLLLFPWLALLAFQVPVLKEMIQIIFPFPLLIGSILLFFYIFLLYRLLSVSKRPKYYDTLGAMTSALLWVLFTNGYSIYVNYISTYDTDYGILGLIFLGLLWMKICMMILLYGVRLSHLLYVREYDPIKILRSIFSGEKGIS